MSTADAHLDRVTRRRLRVRGQVQGVGFRPFVYRLARELGVEGYVLNDGRGVVIEAEGVAGTLETLRSRMETEKPLLAQIDAVEAEELEPVGVGHGFEIVRSALGGCEARVTVDTAVCADCVAELLDVRDRRYGYALINCTNCGPRYSIVEGIPYDRENTTMRGFAMCDRCAAEYEDVEDRRHHAQPIACHDCGPTLRLVSPRGCVIPADPIVRAVELLRAGRVLAIKGLGGYHLAVRADDAGAVSRLRLRKHRDAKPLAVMVRGVAAARELVDISEAGVEAMSGPACPIVLAARKAGPRVAEGVAPGTDRLGVMLPYTPIHHLLFAADETLGPLVMTSGNLTDEPLVIDNDEAVERLGGLCDAMLWHDRPIARRVDDSVVLDMGDGVLPIRRARGFVPAPVRMGVASERMGLCVGGELKNTVAVVRGDEVILSHHLGDLKHALALKGFERAVDDLMRLFDVKPAWVACDMHPVYMSSQLARRWAERWEVPLIEVQHHHAHVASLVAEYGLSERVLGIVCDGVGYGDGGAVWGGELLVADASGYERVAHLRPLRLAGGDAAARDARRCGLGLLDQAYGDGLAEKAIARELVPDATERAMLTTMLRRGVRCVESTAAGRVFDGVAALLGVCETNRFEAEAPMALEAAAREGVAPEVGLLFDLEDGQIDLVPLVRYLVHARRRGEAAGDLARLFHEQFAAALAEAASGAAEANEISTVGLTGGVFCNALLTELLTGELERRGLRVLRHRRVPANDGGLALGQALVAATRMNQAKGSESCV